MSHPVQSKPTTALLMIRTFCGSGASLKLSWIPSVLQRRFYERELARENWVRTSVIAIKVRESQPSRYDVLASVVLVSGERCYEDVLTLPWRETPDGWRLLPASAANIR